MSKSSKSYLIIFFIICQLIILVLGISISPMILFAVPIILILLPFLILNPNITLMLLAIVGLVKGFIISINPIFELIDYTMVLTLLIWCGLVFLFIKGLLRFPVWAYDFIKYFLLFCIVLFLSGFYTPSPIYGWLKIVRFSVFSTTMFLVPFFIINNSNDSKKLLYYFQFIILSVAIGMLGYLIYLLKTGEALSYLVRVTVLNSNPITIGAYLAMGAGIIVNMINRIKFKYSLFLVPLLAIIMITLLSTGSRGPTLGLLAGLVTYTIFFEKNKYRRNKLILTGLFTVCILIIVLFVLPDFITTRFLNIGTGDFVVYQSGVQRVSTIALRLGFWKTSLIEWSSSIKSFIIGIGSGGFSSLYILRDFRHFPHNFFIEALLETGVIGFAIILLLFYKGWKYLRTNVEYSFHTSLWITALLVRFFTSQFSGDLVDNRVLFMLLSISIISYSMDSKEGITSSKI